MAKKMKDTAVEDRPREKLLKTGNVNCLTNTQLVAMLLGSGMKGRDVNKLAAVVRARLDKEKCGISLADLQSIKGLGDAKVCTILGALALGKRYAGIDIGDLSSTEPEEVVQRLTDIRRSKKEHFVVFYLDARERELFREIVSVGTVSASLVHPREVFQKAIKVGSSSIIVAHNHPSGQTSPSDADIHITKRLVQAGEVLGIEVHDHIIVTKDDFNSLRESHPDLFEE